MGFKDHFSGHADEYRRYRPGYPAELFAWLASIAPRTEHALDCGTGNGQAARLLTPYFARVTATDASPEQIRNALEDDDAPSVGLRFAVAPAEASGLDSASCDLVTVAQAFHWFDHRRFYDEVQRVLRPNGLLALISYSFSEVSPEIDAVFVRYYSEVVGPYWPAERSHVVARYADIDLPFDELDAVPPFVMRLSWTLEEYAGYLGTWSAAKRYRAARGHDPYSIVAGEFAAAWGDPGRARDVVWPVTLRVFRVNG